MAKKTKIEKFVPVSKIQERINRMKDKLSNVVVPEVRIAMMTSIATYTELLKDSVEFEITE